MEGEQPEGPVNGSFSREYKLECTTSGEILWLRVVYSVDGEIGYWSLKGPRIEDQYVLQVIGRSENMLYKLQPNCWKKGRYTSMSARYTQYECKVYVV